MSQPRKNANILSFFKPVPRPQTPQSSQTSGPSDPPSTSPLPPSPSPLPPSSPFSHRHTPAIPRAPLTRDLEIGDTDDDGFGTSSDDSLEDLSAILGRGRPGTATRSPAKTLLGTPRAKRTAVEFPASPLALITKHKFDLKALAKDARKDNATNASSMRAKALADFHDEAGQTSIGEASRETLEGIEGGHDAQKVLRAVQRTEGGTSLLRYCFFVEEHTPPSPTAAPTRVKHPWKLLTQGDQNTRELHLASGVPMTLVAIHGGLPDELFVWMLKELFAQKSSLIRQEYCNLLGKCPEQIERLVTPQRLEELFLLLGASPELEEPSSELVLSKTGIDPYQGRDWSHLGYFLTILKLMAPHLSLEAVFYASRTLLRMAMDKFLIYNIDLLVQYEDTMNALLRAVPFPNWDAFCFETCSLLYSLTKAQGVRVNPLACLSISNTESHELRRRLAVAFLFRDPALGRHHPDTVITIRGIINRTEEDDFAATPKTDFAELQACIVLLNIAVDDGSFVKSDDPEDERRFNDEIDELSARLREIWKKINDAGMKLARTEAKSVIDWVQQRLTHTIRTRRKAKHSIFDFPGEKKDRSLPKEQKFMKNFLRKAPSVDEDTIVVAPI
ncbi:hypothetical protein QQZ08_006797 [Neonectria magnoliae]|uniref:Uncharacterized protein n=1 Tax=Neonectria magnoliae TaxID=2732573 RepID=A0ABR1I009_9HYPO